MNLANFSYPTILRVFLKCVRYNQPLVESINPYTFLRSCGPTGRDEWLTCESSSTAIFEMDSGELKVDVPLASMESDVDEEQETSATGSR